MGRYIVTVSYYEYADSDKEVFEKARAFADKQNKQFDNSTTVDGVESAPFGSLCITKIKEDK